MSEEPLDANEPSQTDDRNDHASWTFFALILPLILVVYVLSIGPVAKLTDKGILPQARAIEVFYSPIAALVGHNVLAGKFMKWYLFDVWRVTRPQ